MTIEQTCAIIAVIFSALSGTFALYTHFHSLRIAERGEKSALVRALQGEKESIIYIAHMAVSPRWEKRLKDRVFRAELLTALCVAWPMESSDRVRAAIFKALHKLTTDHHKRAVTEELQTLRDSFMDYQMRFHDEAITEDITDVTALATQLGIVLTPLEPLEPTTKPPEPPPGHRFFNPDKD